MNRLWFSCKSHTEHLALSPHDSSHKTLSVVCYISSSLCNFSVTSTTTDNKMSIRYNLSSGFSNTSQVNPFRTLETLNLHNTELLTRRDTHANKSVWCHFVIFTMGIKAIYINRPQLQCCLWEDFHTRTSPVKISIISCSEFTSVCEYKLTLTIWGVPGESFWTARQPEAEVPDSMQQIQKEAFNSSLEGTQLDVWCEKTPGQSERVQNSRLTLSHWALWTLSHNSSPAVISSSSLPCHPFFFHLRRRSPAEERGWNPRPRTTSSTRQERQIFPEPPPPQYGHLLDRVWGQYFETWVRNE